MGDVLRTHSARERNAHGGKVIFKAIALGLCLLGGYWIGLGLIRNFQMDGYAVLAPISESQISRGSKTVEIRNPRGKVLHLSNDTFKQIMRWDPFWYSNAEATNIRIAHRYSGRLIGLLGFFAVCISTVFWALYYRREPERTSAFGKQSSGTRLERAVQVPAGRTVMGVPEHYIDQVARDLSRAAELRQRHGLEVPETEYADISEEYFARYLHVRGSEEQYVPGFLVDSAPVRVHEFVEFMQKLIDSDAAEISAEDIEFWLRKSWRDPDRANSPITGVAWDEANLFCACHGGRLPTTGELTRIVRTQDDCPDLMRGFEIWSKHVSQQPEKSVDSRLQSQLETWCGCEILGIDEWTSTVRSAPSKARESARVEYEILESIASTPFPLIELTSGLGSRRLSEDRRFGATRYPTVGFRCVYSGLPEHADATDPFS